MLYKLESLKEENTMYQKPQLIPLGDTSQLVRSSGCPGSKASCIGDGGNGLQTAPAYEADE
jgi:hypothetical protein